MSVEEFIGSKLSILCNSDIRYEGLLFYSNIIFLLYYLIGLLYTLNTEDGTLVLQDVRCLGTQDRDVDVRVPESHKIHDFIVFKGDF